MILGSFLAGKAKQFDCVASTGNSLPHVNNDDVLTALEQMNSLVKKADIYIWILEIGKKF